MWLSWQSSPGCSPARYRVERATDPSAGPWDIAQNTNETSFKDVNRLNRMQLWYRVVGTDCRSHSLDSDTVPATPIVRPYSWDFGRHDEGLSGTTEGWTTGQNAAAASGTGQGGSGTSPTVKPKGKKKKNKTTTTTQGAQGPTGPRSGPNVALTALIEQTGSTATTAVNPGKKAKKKGSGKAGKKSAAGTKGVLTVNAPPGNPTAVSPDGLNMPAATYKHLNIGLVGDVPPSVNVRWVVTGQNEWSQPLTCSLVTQKNGAAQCEIKDLSAASDGWTGNIRRLEIAFPGATSAVSVDLVHFESAGPETPLVGAIRWDGWFPGNVESQAVDNSLYTDFDYRQPFYGWFDAPGPATVPPGSTHSSVLPQHQLDLLQEMQEGKAGGIDFWAFNWYVGSPEVPQNPTPSPYVSALTDYESYLHGLRGDQRPLLDYALILGASEVSHQDRKSGQIGTTPYWNSVLIPRLIQHFKEQAYVKVDGNRPVVYWFGTKDLATDAGFGSCSTPNGGCWRTALAQLVNQVKATPGLGAPYFVDVTSDASAATEFGFDALTSYGPAVVGPVTYSPTAGRQPWTSATLSRTPEAIDDAVARQTIIPQQGQMLSIQPGLTATLDHRPLNSGTQYAAEHQSPADFWFEYPTYTEWETHLRSVYDDLQLYPGRSSQPGIALIYAWNEVSEGGGIVPSAQYGSYFLDALRAVRSGNYPSRYWDTWNDSNPVIQYHGGWQEAGPNPDYQQTKQAQLYPTTDASGSYTNDEHLDPNGPGNVGDAAVIDLTGTTAVRLIATMGPDRGIARVDLDGQAVDVNLYAPTTTRQAIVFERDGLAKGKHRLTISTTARQDPRATGATIGVDALSALVERVGVDGTGTLPPARVTAQGLAGHVALSWDPVPGATGYRIYGADSFTGPWRQIGEVPARSQSVVYNDTGVPPGMHAWYYQVRTVTDDRESPGSDVAPAITTDDLSRGATTSTGNGPGGAWQQALFSGGARQTFDEVVLANPPGQARVTVEVTADGGASWKMAYRSQAPGEPGNALGDRRSITFPAASGTGVRVTVSGLADPPAFQTYLR